MAEVRVSLGRERTNVSVRSMVGNLWIILSSDGGVNWDSGGKRKEKAGISGRRWRLRSLTPETTTAVSSFCASFTVALPTRPVNRAILCTLEFFHRYVVIVLRYNHASRSSPFVGVATSETTIRSTHIALSYLHHHHHHQKKNALVQGSILLRVSLHASQRTHDSKCFR